MSFRLVSTCDPQPFSNNVEDEFLFETFDPHLGYTHSKKDYDAYAATEKSVLPGFLLYGKENWNTAPSPRIVILGGSTIVGRSKCILHCKRSARRQPSPTATAASNGPSVSASNLRLRHRSGAVTCAFYGKYFGIFQALHAS